MERDRVVKQLFDERIALMAYINSIIHDRHHAEDLFQDLSVEAIEKSETLNDAAHMTRWLRVGARYRAIDHMRRQGSKAIAFTSDLQDKLDLIWDVKQAEPDGPRAEALRGCLGQLPKNTREIIQLRYQDGLSGKQIAQDAGRSSNAIYLALSRAHQALRDCIQVRIEANRLAQEGGVNK